MHFSVPQGVYTQGLFCKMEDIFELVSAREVNPIDPSLTKLIDFFCYLFDTLELSVAYIKGYRSAISNTLKFSKADCTVEPVISDLIKGFALRRPVSRSLTPKWNLTCVLWPHIKAPYEPLKTADIKYITLKAVFLLTFAAARSEFYALSVEEGCFRYDRNSDSIIFLTQPGFLAKNQLQIHFQKLLLFQVFLSFVVLILMTDYCVLSELFELIWPELNLRGLVGRDFFYLRRVLKIFHLPLFLAGSAML